MLLERLKASFEKGLICLSCLSICLIFASCGSLHTFVKVQDEKNATVASGKKVYIEAFDCNPNECIQAISETHRLLLETLKEYLVLRGYRSVDNIHDSNLVFKLVTTHEETIESEFPRNMYLVVTRRENSNRLVDYFQIGIAESLSTPLTANYISMNLVQDTFCNLLDSTALLPFGNRLSYE